MKAVAIFNPRSFLLIICDYGGQNLLPVFCLWFAESFYFLVVFICPASVLISDYSFSHALHMHSGNRSLQAHWPVVHGSRAVCFNDILFDRPVGPSGRIPSLSTVQLEHIYKSVPLAFLSLWSSTSCIGLFAMAQIAGCWICNAMLPDASRRLFTELSNRLLFSKISINIMNQRLNIISGLPMVSAA